MEAAPTLDDVDETVSLPEILAARGRGLEESELWALLHECCLILDTVCTAGDSFQTPLRITAESVVFDPAGNLCLLDLDEDPETLYAPPEYEKEVGSSVKSHLYSLGMILLHSGKYSISGHQMGELSDEIWKTLGCMTAEDHSERPDIVEVLAVCKKMLGDRSSWEICENLAHVFQRARSFSSQQSDASSVSSIASTFNPPVQSDGDNVLDNAGFSSASEIWCMPSLEDKTAAALSGCTSQSKGLCQGYNESGLVVSDDVIHVESFMTSQTRSPAVVENKVLNHGEEDSEEQSATEDGHRAIKFYQSSMLSEPCMTGQMKNYDHIYTNSSEVVNYPLFSIGPQTLRKEHPNETVYENETMLPKDVQGTAEELTDSSTDQMADKFTSNNQLDLTNTHNMCQHPREPFTDHDDQSECEELLSLPDLYQKSHIKQQSISQKKGVTVAEVTDLTGISFNEIELWAVCRETVLFLNRRKDFPAFISPDTIVIKQNGSITFGSIPEEKPLQMIFMAPEFRQSGILTDKTCVYGLATSLCCAAGYKNSSDLPVEDELMSLFTSMLHGTAESRPSFQEILMICDRHEEAAEFSSRSVCQSLCEDACQYLQKKHSPAENNQENIGLPAKLKISATLESNPTTSCPDNESSAVSAFKPISSKQGAGLTGLPSAYTSFSTHFKPIVLEPCCHSVQNCTTRENLAGCKESKAVGRLKELKEILMKHKKPRDKRKCMEEYTCKPSLKLPEQILAANNKNTSDMGSYSTKNLASESRTVLSPDTVSECCIENINRPDFFPQDISSKIAENLETLNKPRFSAANSYTGDKSGVKNGQGYSVHAPVYTQQGQMMSPGVGHFLCSSLQPQFQFMALQTKQICPVIGQVVAIPLLPETPTVSSQVYNQLSRSLSSLPAAFVLANYSEEQVKGKVNQLLPEQYTSLQIQSGSSSVFSTPVTDSDGQTKDSNQSDLSLSLGIAKQQDQLASTQSNLHLVSQENCQQQALDNIQPAFAIFGAENEKNLSGFIHNEKQTRLLNKATYKDSFLSGTFDQCSGFAAINNSTEIFDGMFKSNSSFSEKLTDGKVQQQQMLKRVIHLLHVHFNEETSTQADRLELEIGDFIVSLVGLTWEIFAQAAVQKYKSISWTVDLVADLFQAVNGKRPVMKHYWNNDSYQIPSKNLETFDLNECVEKFSHPASLLQKQESFFPGIMTGTSTPIDQVTDIKARCCFDGTDHDKDKDDTSLRLSEKNDIGYLQDNAKVVVHSHDGRAVKRLNNNAGLQENSCSEGVGTEHSDGNVIFPEYLDSNGKLFEHSQIKSVILKHFQGALNDGSTETEYNLDAVLKGSNSKDEFNSDENVPVLKDSESLKTEENTCLPFAGSLTDHSVYTSCQWTSEISLVEKRKSTNLDFILSEQPQKEAAVVGKKLEKSQSFSKLSICSNSTTPSVTSDSRSDFTSKKFSNRMENGFFSGENFGCSRFSEYLKTDNHDCTGDLTPALDKYSSSNISRASSSLCLLVDEDSLLGRKSRAIYNPADLQFGTPGPEVHRFVKQTETIDKDTESLTCQHRALKQEIAVERKLWVKTCRFYSRLRDSNKANKGTYNDKNTSQILKDLTEMKQRLAVLEMMRNHIEMLLVESFGIPNNLIYSLAVHQQSSDRLTLYPCEHNPLLLFQVRPPAVQILHAGTSAGLLAYLFSKSAISVGFVHQFLYCFRYFLKLDELLSFLRAKHTTVNPDGDTAVGQVQTRALDLLLFWVEGYYSIDFSENPELLDQLHSLLNQMDKSDTTTQTIYEVLEGHENRIISELCFINEDERNVQSVKFPTSRKKDIWNLMTSKTDVPKEHFVLPVCSFKGQVNVKQSHLQRITSATFLLTDYAYDHLAQQLTLIEQELFQLTHPVHYLNSRAQGITATLANVGSTSAASSVSLRNDKTGGGENLFIGQSFCSQTVHGLMEHSQRLAHWVTAELVICSSVKSQVALLTEFLLVAQFCTEIHNYATAMAILDGLENIVIRQLLAWTHLPSKWLQIMETLRSVKISLKSDSFFLVKTPSFHWHPTIPSVHPFLLHVQQLEIGGFTLANGMYKWSKLRCITEVIDQIRVFKQHRYGFERDSEFSDFLKERIVKFSEQNLESLASEFGADVQKVGSGGLRGALKKMKMRLQSKASK